MIKRVSLLMFVFTVVACSDLDTSAYRRKRTQDSIATREYAEKVTIEYTDSGYLRARVFSPVLVAVKQSGSQFIEMNKGLKVDFYDPDGSIASYMTAEYGISYPDKKEIIVRRNVEILNVKGEVLNTEELRWDQRTGKIITDRFVKITTKDQIITGQGLISDQSFTDWEILEVSATLNVPHDQIPRLRSVVPGRGRY
jgi:LPS export ABC transporter protein LptC